METSGKSDRSHGDQIFGEAGCGKLSTERMKVPDSGLAKNLQRFEAYGEVAEKVNDRLEEPCSSCGGSATQRDDLDINVKLQLLRKCFKNSL